MAAFLSYLNCNNQFRLASLVWVHMHRQYVATDLKRVAAVSGTGRGHVALVCATSCIVPLRTIGRLPLSFTLLSA